ncbi:acetyl-CoA carboxylase, carboxyltransferase subunit beta [Rhodovibrio salinarum]|uniref:Acetyl-coenzyme A carboxylase carboxyl transferase subunit beta n=1 Tax=Rhodovibrio salinarum TaxID=1087 RepID=A0A934QIB5_9PROT|nr:acetyl-CoA carboxylase, carboxyltransferase subunit beta [Rhodovibrio salinarum]MBK1697232.1 acetyl-CoA carboxylase carboxyltransferase subunit beta [Rhodovibrio salinarum]
MSWISNYVRPKFRALVTRQDIPDDLWEKCPDCGQMIFHRELEKALRVCTHCGYHLRIGPHMRMKLLFDSGQYTPIELPETIQDPLKFRDRKRYGDRLREARAKAEGNDAIVVAHGRMGGHPVVMACFDFSFMGGSMGIAVGEGLLAAARLACMQEAPLLVVPASGGARMQEGILSLMQMPRTTVAVDMVKEKGLPYVVLLTDPTTGGVSASFAMLGDLTLAEPGSVIGFAGQRVIEATVREQLPEGFQRAEYLRDHGMVDQVVDRRELRDRLITLFSLLTRTKPEARIIPLPEGALKLDGPRVASHGPRIDDGQPKAEPQSKPEAVAETVTLDTSAKSSSAKDTAATAQHGEKQRSSWSLSLTGRSRDKNAGDKAAEKTKPEKDKSDKAKAEKKPDKKSEAAPAGDKNTPSPGNQTDSAAGDTDQSGDPDTSGSSTKSSRRAAE